MPVLVLEHQHALPAQLAEAAVADEMEDVDRLAVAQPRLQGLGGGARQPFDLDQAAAQERLQGRAEPPPLLVRLGELPVASRGRDHGQDPQRRLDQQRAEALAQLQVAHHRRAAGERQEAPALGVVQVLPGQPRQLGDVVEAQADAQSGPALGLGETALESLQQLALEDGAEQLVPGLLRTGAIHGLAGTRPGGRRLRR